MKKATKPRLTSPLLCRGKGVCVCVCVCVCAGARQSMRPFWCCRGRGRKDEGQVSPVDALKHVRIRKRAGSRARTLAFPFTQTHSERHKHNTHLVEEVVDKRVSDCVCVCARARACLRASAHDTCLSSSLPKRVSDCVRLPPLAPAYARATGGHGGASLGGQGGGCFAAPK